MHRPYRHGDLFGNLKAPAKIFGRVPEQLRPEHFRRKLVEREISADGGEDGSVLPQTGLLKKLFGKT